MIDLIGKRFTHKSKVTGMADWEDVIDNVFVVKLISLTEDGWIPHIKVKAKSTGNVYSIDEILILD